MEFSSVPIWEKKTHSRLRGKFKAGSSIAAGFPGQQSRRRPDDYRGKSQYSTSRRRLATTKLNSLSERRVLKCCNRRRGKTSRSTILKTKIVDGESVRERQKEI